MRGFGSEAVCLKENGIILTVKLNSSVGVMNEKMADIMVLRIRFMESIILKKVAFYIRDALKLFVLEELAGLELRFLNSSKYLC